MRFFELEDERLEMSQRDKMKSKITMAAPTAIPITTHNRIPKIEVGFESWSSMNPAFWSELIEAFHQTAGGQLELYKRREKTMVGYVVKEEEEEKVGGFGEERVRERERNE